MLIFFLWIHLYTYIHTDIFSRQTYLDLYSQIIWCHICTTNHQKMSTSNKNRLLNINFDRILDRAPNTDKCYSSNGGRTIRLKIIKKPNLTYPNLT